MAVHGLNAVELEMNEVATERHIQECGHVQNRDSDTRRMKGRERGRGFRKRYPWVVSGANGSWNFEAFRRATGCQIRGKEGLPKFKQIARVQ